MLETNLTEKQIEFMEHYYCPTALTECLIPQNLNAPQNWPKVKNIFIRPYQFAMQNYSYMFAHDIEKSDAENIRIKKGAGDLYSIGSRNTGKSFFIKIDMFLSYIHHVAEICLASFDDYHLKKIASPIADILENHKFAKIFHNKESRKGAVKRDPLNAKTAHGCTIESANEHVKGNNPGEQFHAKHYDALYYEEFSYASDEGTRKRIDSGNSMGYIFRPSGIPDLCIGSPLGKILENKDLRNWTWSLPQMVRADWNEKTETRIAEEYGGKLTPGYKLNVLAETIPGAFGWFDMERLEEASVKKTKRVKFFEISKENFVLYDQLLHVDRMPGTESIYITADLGFGSAPTEIAIIFFDGKKYNYVYNISLLRLTPEEQPEIFKYLYDKLGGAFIALDSTSDSGAMIDRLFKMGVPLEHLLKVRFNKNIEVGFEKDADGNDLCDDKGNPVMKKVRTEDWSYTELERFMYNGDMVIPYDQKFLNQFTNIFATKTKGKLLYGSKGANHLVQSIPKNEVITCKINDELVVDSVENIYNQTSNVTVPTYDNGKLSWKPGKIIKELNKGNDIFDFKFKPGKSLQVTEGHSMMVWNTNKQCLDEKLAKNIKIGDLCLVAQNLHIEPPTDYLSLNLSYAIGKGAKLKNYTKLLDEDMAYFIGWCCAEGSMCGDKGYQLTLCFDDPINKLENLIEKLFSVKPRLYKHNKVVMMVLRGGMGITKFIEGQIGKWSKTKIMPVSILNSKISVQDAFQRGLIEGDGTAEGRLTSTSRMVTNGIFTLNTLKGAHTTLTLFKNKYGNYEYYSKLAVRDKYFENIPYDALKSDYSKKTGKTISRNKIANANYTWIPTSNSNKEILTKIKDFEFVEVTKIDSFKYDDYIYDLSVDDTNNFLAGVGNVVVHNSFQCFAICRFFNEFNLLRDSRSSVRSYGIFNVRKK